MPKLYRVLAGYDDKKTYVGLSYQYTDGFQGLWEKRFASVNKPLRPTVKTHEAVISASHKIGRFTPRASYAHGWDETLVGGGRKVGNTSYDQIIISGDYAFNKSTIAMTSLGWIRKPEDYGHSSNGDNVGIKYSSFSRLGFAQNILSAAVKVSAACNVRQTYKNLFIGKLL